MPKTLVDAQGVSFPSGSSEFADTLSDTRSMASQYEASGGSLPVAAALNPQDLVEADSATINLANPNAGGSALPSTGKNLPVIPDPSSAGIAQVGRGERLDEGVDVTERSVDNHAPARPQHADAEPGGRDKLEAPGRESLMTNEYLSHGKPAQVSDATMEASQEPELKRTTPPLAAPELLRAQISSDGVREATAPGRNSPLPVQRSTDLQNAPRFSPTPTSPKPTAEQGLPGDQGRTASVGDANLLTVKDLQRQPAAPSTRVGPTPHASVQQSPLSLAQTHPSPEASAGPAMSMKTDAAVVDQPRPIGVDTDLRTAAPQTSGQTPADGGLREHAVDPRRVMQLPAKEHSSVPAQSAAITQQKAAEALLATAPVAANTAPQVAIAREILAKSDPTTRTGVRIENAVSEPVQRLFAFADGELPGKSAVVEVRPVQSAHLPAEPSLLTDVKSGNTDTQVKGEQNMRGVTLGLLPQQVAQSLARLAMSRGRFAIALSPQSLGSIDIEFSEHRGEVSIAIAARETTTRELLEQMLPRLREALSDAGVSLADLDIRQEHRHQQEQRDADALEGETHSTGTQHSDELADEQGALLNLEENASIHILV